MSNTAQRVIDLYTREEPEVTIEDQIIAVDKAVCKKASVRAVVVGILGCLLLGIGMSLTMTTSDFFILGIIVGVAGLVIVCITYPLHKRTLAKLRESERPKIIGLASRL